MTGRQISAARSLLGMTQAELAAAARISIPTLKRIEAQTGNANAMLNNLLAIRVALESQGIEFIAADQPSLSGGPGVRLRS